MAAGVRGQDQLVEDAEEVSEQLLGPLRIQNAYGIKQQQKKGHLGELRKVL